MRLPERKFESNYFQLDLFDIFYGGATALYFTDDGIAKISTTERRGERPWSRNRR